MVLDVRRRALGAALIESVGIVGGVATPEDAAEQADHAVKEATLAREISLLESQWSAPHVRTETSSDGARPSFRTHLAARNVWNASCVGTGWSLFVRPCA